MAGRIRVTSFTGDTEGLNDLTKCPRLAPCTGYGTSARIDPGEPPGYSSNEDHRGVYPSTGQKFRTSSTLRWPGTRRRTCWCARGGSWPAVAGLDSPAEAASPAASRPGDAAPPTDKA